jgi:hypothetical protein
MIISCRSREVVEAIQVLGHSGFEEGQRVESSGGQGVDEGRG